MSLSKNVAKFQTYLWVINEEDDFKTAFELGAEGVMTDYPTKLTEWLNKNPQYWTGNKNNTSYEQMS